MLTTQDLRFILRAPLFGGVPATEFEQAFKGIDVERRHFMPDQLLFREGLRWDQLWILAQGSLNAEIARANGQTIRVEQMQAPIAIATGILFADDNTLPVSLRAETAGYLVGITKRNLLVLTTRLSGFTEQLLREAGNKISFLAAKLRIAHLTTIRDKVAAYLVDLAVKQDSTEICPSFSKTTLSELFGVTRPALSRTFSEMSREGLFHEQGRHIMIDDRGALEAIADAAGL